ncbi:MAG: sensor histidine kinase [Thiohalomonadaceae bacterium]
MHSLFLKIFLAIWASLLLLGLSLLLLERQLGGQELEARQQWLAAHADTAAALYRQDGLRAVQGWLRGLRQSEQQRVWLLNEQGQSPLTHRQPPRHNNQHHWSGQAGIQHQQAGVYQISVPIPDIQPSLFLVTQVDLGRLRHLGPLTRLGLALLSSVLVSLLLAHLLSRRLRRLRQTVQRMAGGDLQVRSHSRGGDEIAALGRDVDQMADALQGMLTNQKLLLRDVSHELRSPLARLRVALELAEQNGDSARALARITQEADALEALVSDLLSLARLDTDNLLQRRERFDLVALLEQLARDVGFEAQLRQGHLRLDAPASLSIEGDAVLLRSALENVLRNGVRHSPDGGELEVRLSEQDGMARISICDRGEGVPEADLQRIFEPFVRVAEARDRHSGGHGLGLAICARIIHAHQGQVQASKRPGGGLCVQIQLPIGSS